MKSIEITLSTGATLKIWETGSAQKDEKGNVIEGHNLQVYLKHPSGTIDRHTISLKESNQSEYFNDNVLHDDRSCMAMIEFERYARSVDKHLSRGQLSPVTYADKQRFADKYSTNTKEMDKHWRCAEQVLGRDPNGPRKPILQTTENDGSKLYQREASLHKL